MSALVFSRAARAGLNFFFAGLFGLVLPFICWGVQAAPGHPHARAHFVFLAPEGHAPDSAPHTHDHGAAELPPGKAAPSLLAAFLLLLVVQIAAWAARADAPGFAWLLPAPAARWIVLRQELPPPRRP